ncbi:MAG TPA: c-type cytochrome [Burkholderiales bacterium]|nr:c-type cytochrome [Burkholderiales bacterium]
MALLALAASLGHPTSALAQPSLVKPSAGDDLRALYASAPDVAEGKRVADTTCARCHGANGISATKGIPHLAGQRPGYLLLELRAYQSGRRGNDMMDGAVKFLSDEALIKVAAYYASLEPVRPGADSAKGRPAPLDPVQAGKTAAAGCAGCHGEAGISKTPGTPSLVGLDPQYFVAAMKAYQNGQRKNDLMKSMAAGIADADLENIALYYALQKAGRAPTPAPGDRAAGKAAAAACAGCHGDTGVSGSATPSIAGQDAQYFAAALKAYKDGARSEETMKSLAASLDERTVRNIAAFYAAQQPRAPKVRRPLTVAEWAQRCDRCHGVNGNSTDLRAPALAGQRVEYLEKVLRAYRTGARKSPEMAAMSEGLKDTDIESLAAHYARQTARAVVYVVVPSK